MTERSLNSEALTAESFIVALPHRHRFTTTPRIRLSALSDEPFIFFPRDSVPQFYDPRDQVVQRPIWFSGWWLRAWESPWFLVGPQAPRSGVAFRALDPSPRLLETAVAWRRDNSSPTLNVFLEIVREVFTLSRDKQANEGSAPQV